MEGARPAPGWWPTAGACAPRSPAAASCACSGSWPRRRRCATSGPTTTAPTGTRSGSAPSARRRPRPSLSPMSEPPQTRWAQLTGGADGEDYAGRFAALAASGADVHGEASYAASLVPPPARVLDAGCGTGRVAARLAELGYDVHRRGRRPLDAGRRAARAPRPRLGPGRPGGAAGGRRGSGRRVRPGARRRQRHSAAGRGHPAVDGGRARPGAGSVRAAGLRLRAGRRPPAPRVPGDPAVGVRPRPATRRGWGWSGGWRPGTARRTTGAATRSAFTPLQALCIRPSLDSLGVPPLATVGPASTGTKGDHHR